MHSLRWEREPLVANSWRAPWVRFTPSAMETPRLPRGDVAVPGSVRRRMFLHGSTSLDRPQQQHPPPRAAPSRRAFLSAALPAAFLAFLAAPGAGAVADCPDGCSKTCSLRCASSAAAVRILSCRDQSESVKAKCCHEHCTGLATRMRLRHGINS